MNTQLDQLKDQIIPVLKKHGITRAGVFGSIARGDFGEKSDVDVLVELGQEMSLLDFIGVEQELESKLNREVDLVEYHLLKPRIKDKILSQEVRIL